MPIRDEQRFYYVCEGECDGARSASTWHTYDGARRAQLEHEANDHPRTLQYLGWFKLRETRR